MAALENLVLVVLDDTGIEQFRRFLSGGTSPGLDYPTTPNFDAFFAGDVSHPSVCFDRFYAQQLCTPTRASLQTGSHCEDHGLGTLASSDGGVPNTYWTLQENAVTIPRALAGLALAFGYFGKWHLDSTDGGGPRGPLRHGWHFFQGQDRNFATPEEGYYRHTMNVNGELTRSTWFLNAFHAQAAKDWITKKRRAGQRFVCQLAFYSNHVPNTGENTPPAAEYQTGTWGVPPIFDPAAAAKAHVESMDYHFGRFMQAVNLDTDLVIVLSDNGSTAAVLAQEQMTIDGAKFAYTSGHAKNTPYEPAIRVPCGFRGTDALHGASRVKSTLHHVVDIIPTLLELFGVAAPANYVRRGIPLASELVGGADAAHQYVWSSNFAPSAPNKGTTVGDRAVISDRYKLLRRQTTASSSVFEFYDLKPAGFYNPMELVNLTPGGSTATLTTPQRAALVAMQAWQDDLMESVVVP